MIMVVGERLVPHVHAGNIPLGQSRIYALAEWANDCERKLLNLHCGLMLDRRRHMAWAAKMLAKYDPS